MSARWDWIVSGQENVPGPLNCTADGHKPSRPHLRPPESLSEGREGRSSGLEEAVVGTLGGRARAGLRDDGALGCLVVPACLVTD